MTPVLRIDGDAVPELTDDQVVAARHGELHLVWWELVPSRRRATQPADDEKADGFLRLVELHKLAYAYVRPRRRFAEVVVDLGETDTWLSTEAQETALTLLREGSARGAEVGCEA